MAYRGLRSHRPLVVVRAVAGAAETPRHRQAAPSRPFGDWLHPTDNSDKSTFKRYRHITVSLNHLGLRGAALGVSVRNIPLFNPNFDPASLAALRPSAHVPHLSVCFVACFACVSPEHGQPRQQTSRHVHHPTARASGALPAAAALQRVR